MSEKPVPDITPNNREFFEGCAQGELRIRLCHNCGARFRFAHGWCPQCWSSDIGWEVASGRGSITHVTVVYQPPLPAFEPQLPYALVLVELDDGVRMMGNVIGCDPESVRIGLPVEVFYEPRGEVMIPQFRPAGDGSATRRE